MSIREIMPHIPPRWDGHNQWYFVTVITQKRQLLFADTDPCEILKQAFREERKHHPFRLAGLVILPDHWHALIRPNDGGVIETIVGNIKKKAWSDIAAPRPTIWQPRFLDHRIRNQEDFAYHLEYIRLNAIKHGYAESPKEHQWCFIHQHPLWKMKPWFENDNNLTFLAGASPGPTAMMIMVEIRLNPSKHLIPKSYVA